MFPPTAVMADYTRCVLAIIMYGVTGWAVIGGNTLPQEWWYAFFGVTGFFFAMEVPTAARRIIAAVAASPDEAKKPEGKA